jgi:hypothetical protein
MNSSCLNFLLVRASTRLAQMICVQPGGLPMLPAVIATADTSPQIGLAATLAIRVLIDQNFEMQVTLFNNSKATV